MFRPVRDEMSKITFLLPKFCAYGTYVNNPVNPTNHINHSLDNY